MTAFVYHVTFDCADPDRLAAFWSAVTGYESVAETEDVVALHAPDEQGVRRMLFFRVPEPKTVKNRVHVDLAVKDAATEIEGLVGHGTTRSKNDQGGGAAGSGRCHGYRSGATRREPGQP
jgi:catechol 2,3-dioxygenase-like lactoylglutathione lyase family enzyme